MEGTDDTATNPFAILAGGINPQVALDHDQTAQVQQGLTAVAGNISHPGSDAPYIKDLEEWSGKTHQEIYQGAQAMRPGIIAQQAQAWEEIGASLGGGLFGLNLGGPECAVGGVSRIHGECGVGQLAEVRQAGDRCAGSDQ